MNGSKPINFGIAGFGNIGVRHAAHIAANPMGRLLAVCDIDTQKLRGLEEGVAATGSFAELLSTPGLDVVNICTPNHLHAPMTVAALQAGKHVVCEKPMAMSSGQCAAMTDAAAKSGKKLFVVKQNRYNPPVQAVRRLIDQNKLGKVYQVAINCLWNRNDAYYAQSGWRGTKDKDGGCLFTQCSHFVDIMHHLFGDVDCIAGRVQNAAHRGLVEFEDCGSFVLATKRDGAIVSFNFTTAAYAQNMEGAITIIAQNATIKIGGQYLNTIEYQKTAGFDIPPLPQGKGCNDYGQYKGSMSNHDKVIQNVIDTLHGQAEIATKGADGSKVVDIIERMYLSAGVELPSTAHNESLLPF